MKITLIEAKPAAHNGFERFVIPRLGLPTIGAMLKRAGHEVQVYVHQLEGILPHSVDIFRSDLIGLSTTTPSAVEAYDLARWIRRINRVRGKTIPIVLGGPHVTFLPEEGLLHGDYVVRGEGEFTMLELVEALETGSDLADIRGLSYRDGDRIHHNPDRLLCADLDQLPDPDLRLIVGHEKLRYLPISTSRGCPHDCDFCSVVSMFGRGHRRVSNARVLHALEDLLTLGNRIFFVDDNFAGNRTLARELLVEMKRRALGRRMRWFAQVTVHAARDEELLRLMHDTNCTQVYVGFESINPATLRAFGKSQTVDQIRDSVRAFHRHGIRVHGMFVLGSDEDDCSTVEATVEFARKHDIDTAQFAILLPLPGTRTFEALRDRIISTDWRLYDGFHVVHRPARMSPFDLQRAAMAAWREFYSVPASVQAFTHLKVATGLLRLYGRQIVKRGLSELEEYLEALQPTRLPSEA